MYIKCADLTKLREGELTGISRLYLGTLMAMVIDLVKTSLRMRRDPLIYGRPPSCHLVWLIGLSTPLYYLPAVYNLRHNYFFNLIMVNRVPFHVITKQLVIVRNFPTMFANRVCAPATEKVAYITFISDCLHIELIYHVLDTSSVLRSLNKGIRSPSIYIPGVR